ncbi:ATP-grasp fold amidoligase family protein [Allosphingosinicella sp.]|jgi:hypothetical protein|uniref:ATP-grasp fold amidoligase family protein n=1 Tax=Allosphingosinicella sp. TaxID=2823234 RepID=UPI002F02BE21
MSRRDHHRMLPFWLKLLHLARNRHWPDLEAPRTFNERIQARKLIDRDPMLPLLADKVKVKDFVAKRLGREWLIPTLWNGPMLPDRPLWPVPFVVKSNHASQQCIFVRDENADWPAIRRRAHRWLRSRYGGILGEWLYSRIEPQILIEPFIGGGRGLPVDYKFFVFGGRAEFVQVDTDREHGHKRTLFDRSWTRLPAVLNFPNDPGEIAPPASLAEMLDSAETLAADMDFARVDFYEVDGRPLFGEMTFYPGSGLDRFTPPGFDLEFGKRWTEGLSRRAGS